MQTHASIRASGSLHDFIHAASSANFSFDLASRVSHNFEKREVHRIIQEQRRAKLASRKKNEEQLICRICLSEEELPDHELISPCSCMGSMRYIGVSCLKEWLEGKRHFKETPFVNSYIWKGLECEICKTPLKDKVPGTDGQEVNLLNYKKYEGCKNQMVIESVTNTTSKTIHVINFDRQCIMKVGRAQIAEVRITDISVSRFHSNLILCDDGTIAVTDNFSKFGTLLLLQKPMSALNKGVNEPIYI